MFLMNNISSSTEEKMNLLQAILEDKSILQEKQLHIRVKEWGQL
jgi:hypothetical protein